MNRLPKFICRNILIINGHLNYGFEFAKQALRRLNPTKMIVVIDQAFPHQEFLNISKNHKNVYIFQPNMSNPSDIDNLIKGIESLVQNEGIQYLYYISHPLSTLSGALDVKSGIPPFINEENENTFVDNYFKNVTFPFLITKKLIPLMTVGGLHNGGCGFSIIAYLSSNLGSIKLNTDGGYISYRASQAAMNMVMRTLAIELQEHKIVVISVSSDSLNVDGGKNITPSNISHVINGIINVTCNIRPGDSGNVFCYSGVVMPW